jgi:mycoredoxin
MKAHPMTHHLTAVRRLAWVLCALAVFAAPSIVRADWLVRTDGTRIATDGRWKMNEGQIVYRDAEGQEQTVSAAEIDVQASIAASLERTKEFRLEVPAAVGGAAQPPPRSTSGAGGIERAQRSGSASVAAAPAAAAPTAPQGSTPAPPASPPTADAQPIEGPVVLYSTTWCPWCKKTREALTELGVSFEERDIERDPAARAEHSRLVDDGSVPVVARGDSFVRGYNLDGLRELVSDLIPAK